MQRNRIESLGLLAAGVAAAVALGVAPAGAAPGVDWLRWPDPGWTIPDPAADTAAPASEPNLAVALFGIPVLQEGSAHVYSSPGSGLLAIADGAGSIAQTGGFFNTAIAVGDNSAAFAAGVGNLSVAVGDQAIAEYGGFLPPIPIGLPTGDSIYAFGDNARAGIVGGSFNSAAVFGDNSSASAGNGILDFASVYGNNSTALAGEDPDVGNSGSLSLAAVFGDLLRADATGGIFQIDIEPLFGDLGFT